MDSIKNLFPFFVFFPKFYKEPYFHYLLMREITKAQLTIGLLAYFTTVWDLIFLKTSSAPIIQIGIILLQLVLVLVLSYVILALLEWVKVFDLKTNSVLTFLVLIFVRLLSGFLAFK